MKNKTTLIVIASVALMGILFFVGMKIYKANEAKKHEFAAKENFKIFAPDHSIRKGSPDAKVYVTEFFDPECESCRRFHEINVLFLKEYDGRIQYVMRYAPFHTNSIMMVKILEASRKQNKYWEVLEALYEHQPDWGDHHNPKPELVWDFLPATGVNIEQLKVDMENPEIQKIIEMDIKDGKELQITGTPTFYVNGIPPEGFGPDFLKAAIEKALQE
jgi:protein-disulfide isomerase